MVQQEITTKTVINGETVKESTRLVKVWPRKIVLVPTISEDGETLTDAQINYTLPDGSVLSATMSEVAGMGFDAGQADQALRSLFDALVGKSLA